MLAQALAQGQCYVANPDRMKKPVRIDANDVDTLTPMLVWWNTQEINQEYVDARKTIACVDLFKN